ncbi:MAG: hypothetical protein IJL87_03775 [Clostridia bacterium]|nr:hypothetical protein [Clostridia bacterium]
MKNKYIILLILIIIISLSGCGDQKSNKTNKLVFSKNDINEVFLSNEEIEEYTNTYCDFYRNAIALYNHELIDEYSKPLDFYDEYDIAFDIYREMQDLIDNMKCNDNKELATKMQVNATSTKHLLVKLNVNIQEDSAKELRADIIKNYEYLWDGE